MQYRKNFKDKADFAESGIIGPREEAHIVLSTTDKYRPQVANLIKSNDEFLWRVQVRRGFVKVDGKDVPATAVIGVEFSASDIERDGKQS